MPSFRVMCRENERTHKHHIIPSYRGGSDAVENLVEVTITQHAMYHYCNYQLWNSEEDKIAWRMLSGPINIQEAKLEAMRLGCKKSGELTKLKLQDPEENKKHRKKCKEAYQNSPNRDRMISNNRQNQPKAMEAAKRPESKENRKQTFKEIKHQQGERNSQYGLLTGLKKVLTELTKRNLFQRDSIKVEFVDTRKGYVITRKYIKEKDFPTTP